LTIAATVTGAAAPRPGTAAADVLGYDSTLPVTMEDMVEVERTDAELLLSFTEMNEKGFH